MPTLLAFILAPGLGFGLVCFIFAKLLSDSNNLGDSTGDATFYTDGIWFATRKDRISKSEKESFAMNYFVPINRKYVEPDGTKEVHVFTDKDRILIEKKELYPDDDSIFDGELPPIDKPIFKPLN